MTILPRNRNLLVGACDEPREQGIIKIDGQTLYYGMVEAVDDMTKPHVADVGDVVYWASPTNPPSPPPEILTDGNVRRWLLAEHFVLATVKNPGVKMKVVVAKPQTVSDILTATPEQMQNVVRRRELQPQ